MSKNNDEPSALEVLMGLIDEVGVMTFHDQLGEAYAAINFDGANVLRIDSPEFEEWMYSLMWNKLSKHTPAAVISAAVKVKRHEAMSGDPIELFVRVAKQHDYILYDLDKKGTAAITPTEWIVASDKLPIVFKRFNHQESQVSPDENESVSLDKLLDLFNITSPQERLLLKVYLIAAFIPNFPHPVLVVHGTQGSAKSTLCRLIKSLIDPSRADSLCITDDRDIAQLVQTASHHWVLVLDNISYLSDKISDTLARICTGGALSKRKLYTNSEDHIFNVRHLVILNGVTQVITKPDLLDRSILIELGRIPDDKRLTENEVFSKFNALRPKLLAGIFDVASKALGEYPNVKQKNLPRMADFAKYGCAISIALGHSAEGFIKAYKANVGTQNREAIGASPTAITIIEYMKDKESIEMTPSELMSELEFVAIELKLNQSKEFPHAASWLWKRIAGIVPNLQAAGIRAEQGKDKERKIKLWKVEVADSTDSIDSISPLPEFEDELGES